MGVYFGKLYVLQFPVQLPKLCISLSARTPIDMPFKKLIFKILKDDEVLAQAPIDDNVLNAQQTLRPVENLPPGREFNIEAHAIVTLAPFLIEGPTMLRLRAETESEEIKGPGLEIELPGTVPLAATH
jgi:hypothetical protein